MAFVNTISREAATGLLKEQYENVARSNGVDEANKVLEAWSLQPEIAAAWSTWLQTAKERTGMDLTLFELMECRMMYVLKCRIVLVNHCYILNSVSGWDHDRIKRGVHAPESAGLSARELAVVRFAEKCCLRSHEITKTDVQTLLTAGFTEPQYVALVFTISALIANAIYPNALTRDLNEFSKAYRDIADW